MVNIKESYAPVTLQAVHPLVRGFTWRWHCLQECLITSEIWCITHTTGDKSAVIGVGRNAPVLQLPCEGHLQSCDTVVKCPIPLLTLCCRIAQKDDYATPLYTPWTTPSVPVGKKSFVHAHSATVRGGSF